MGVVDVSILDSSVGEELSTTVGNDVTTTIGLLPLGSIDGLLAIVLGYKLGEGKMG